MIVVSKLLWYKRVDWMIVITKLVWYKFVDWMIVVTKFVWYVCGLNSSGSYQVIERKFGDPYNMKYLSTCWDTVSL